MFFVVNFCLFYCEVSWDFSINPVRNSVHDVKWSHFVSISHCVNSDVQLIHNVVRNATELFVTSRELPENSGIYVNKGKSLYGKYCEQPQIMKHKL
jgi:hypothetical protein